MRCRRRCLKAISRIFICGHPIGQHNARCVTTNLAAMAQLAFRRPVSNAEMARYTALVTRARASGLSFEQAMRVAWRRFWFRRISSSASSAIRSRTIADARIR